MKDPDKAVLNLAGWDDYSEVLIESAGTRIALSLYHAGEGRPCIVFIPGTMTHPLFYDDFLTLLAGAGFNVAGVHPVSHGKSPREKKLFTFTDMLQNITDSVGYCLDHISSDVILMGSSQGGILCLAAAGRDSRIKAAFPHNVLLPTLSSSIYITRFPHFLKPFTRPITSLMKLVARFAPGLELPPEFYLDFDRVTKSKELRDLFFNDPLSRSNYPLRFLASLFTADLTCVSDGSIKCPVVVIASTGDPLFPYSYCLEVYQKIVAPRKEMLVFHEPYHLILNESPERVIDPVVEKLKEYS
jgi:alpha-beta hydrolase superfamily lysophospholipase